MPRCSGLNEGGEADRDQEEHHAGEPDVEGCPVQSGGRSQVRRRLSLGIRESLVFAGRRELRSGRHVVAELKCPHRVCKRVALLFAGALLRLSHRSNLPRIEGAPKQRARWRIP